jgi:hypothetical protein
MEQTQTPKPSSGFFKDLFTPMKPISGGENNTPAIGANAATAPTGEQGQKPAAADTPTHGVVDEKTATQGLNYTSIPAFSQSGQPVDPNAQPGAGASASSATALGGMVKGEWVVSMMDAILPALLVAGLHAIGVKLRKTELQLTEKERQTIAPVMQRCLDTLLLNFDSPWSQLAITIGVIYGGKVAEKGLVQIVEKREEKKAAKAAEAERAAALKQDIKDNPANYEVANTSAADLSAGAVHMPSIEQPFTEEDIKSTQKRRKIGRTKAIEWLTNQAKKNR